MKKTSMFIVCFGLFMGMAGPASAVILDEVADLDLTNVVKAVHWSNNSTFGTPAVDTTISGVTFLAGPHNGTVDGVTNAGNAFGAGDDWQLGPITDDAGLNDILNSFLIGDPAATITIPVSNGVYKLQLLFFDPFVDTGRGIDVTIEGVLVFNDYFQAVEQGGDALSGSLLTYVFTVADGQVDILFDDPKNAGNYLLSGLILSKDNIASNPDPSNGETMVVVEKVLSWDAPGAYTPSGYDVYLDTDETKVATGSGTCEYTSSNQPGTTFDPSADLSYSTIYYWRVDAIEGDTTTHQGDIWSFTTGGKATNPSPADKDTYITVPTVDLSWTGDTWATSYKVYAGSSFPLDYLDEVTEPEYPDFPTDGVTTYYWRIDEYVGASPTIDGDVWEFTTRESISCPEGDLDASCRVDLLDL
ncbi:MAG: hypothetical protein GY794_25730, partial [bacterium]|nr:hypothetical protein [bacterium]